MRKALTIVSILLFLQNSKTIAQDFSIGIGYEYVNSPQWDEVIQTYNTSRPYLNNNQTLFQSSFLTEFNYSFKAKNRLASGIRFGHRQIKSIAENDGLSTVFSMQFLDIGYTVTYRPNTLANGFEFEGSVSPIVQFMSKKVDDEIVEIEDQVARAFGIGGRLQANVLYRYLVKETRPFIPYLGVSYTPYLFSPNAERLINQTSGLVDMERTTILSWQVGLRISFFVEPS